MKHVLQGLSIALVSLVLLLPGEAFADRRGWHGRGDHGFGHRGSHHGFRHDRGWFHRHHFRDHRHFGHGSWHPHFGPWFGPRWYWNGYGWVLRPGHGW